MGNVLDLDSLDLNKGVIIEKEDVVESKLNIHRENISKMYSLLLPIKNKHFKTNSIHKHKMFDELYSSIQSLVDSLSEDVLGTYECYEDFLTCVETPEMLGSEIIKYLNDLILDYLVCIENDKDCIGIRATLESFLHDLKVMNYLYKMS